MGLMLYISVDSSRRPRVLKYFNLRHRDCRHISHSIPSHSNSQFYVALTTKNVQSIYASATTTTAQRCHYSKLNTRCVYLNLLPSFRCTNSRDTKGYIQFFVPVIYIKIRVYIRGFPQEE